MSTTTATATPDSTAIVVKDLVKRYGEVEALTGISFAVRRGTVYATGQFAFTFA